VKQTEGFSEHERRCNSGPRAERRDVLKVALGIGLGASVLGTLSAPGAVGETAAGQGASADDDVRQMRPQPGDRFAVQGASGDLPAKPDDLPLGGPQKLAYPVDPETGVVRDGSLLNLVVLVRLDPEDMDAKTRENSAEGVVAYSAVCTHQACPVSMWREDKRTLFCSCHGSQYDPRKRAKVVVGPAKKRLAMLPLKMDGDVLAAAEGFIGRIGRQ
jgi:Rieske Fe-S protein